MLICARGDVVPYQTALHRDASSYAPTLKGIIKYPLDATMLLYWDLFAADYSRPFDALMQAERKQAAGSKAKDMDKDHPPAPKASQSTTVEAIAAVSACRRVTPVDSDMLSNDAKARLQAHTEAVEKACSKMLRDFIDRQTAALSERLTRAAEVDQWKPIGTSLHSSSVVDIFQMLDTVTGRFLQQARQLAPFGSSEVASFDVLVTTLVQRYCKILALGSATMDRLRPTKKIHTAKAKARLRQPPEEKKKRAEEDFPLEDVPLDILCVRFACLQEAIAQLDRLREAHTPPAEKKAATPAPKKPKKMTRDSDSEYESSQGGNDTEDEKMSVKNSAKPSGMKPLSKGVDDECDCCWLGSFVAACAHFVVELSGRRV